ncbi:MAG: FHA domain-containing protein [Blastocatellia bacterium]
MERIVVRHLSDSKANQEDIFPLDGFKEITLGRDPSSSVKFDQETEGMVGRQHARITRNPALPSLFLITDLGSRNGTYVNGQRIFDTVSLKPGDVVQCGMGGPEFRLDLEPEADWLNAVAAPQPASNLIDQTLTQPSKPNLPPPISSIALSVASSDETATPANVASDEWSTPNAEDGALKRVIVGAGVLIGLIALVFGYFAYRKLQLNSLAEAQKITATPQPIASPDASPSATATLGTAETPTDATIAAEKAEADKKTAPVAAVKTAGAIKSKIAPRPRRITSANRIGKVTSAGGKTGKRISGGKVASASAGKAAAATPSGKNKQKANDITDATVSGKKVKKAKKEKKVKY